MLLAAMVFIGNFLFAAHLVGYWTPALSDTGHAWQALLLSVANTLAVLGIRKEFVDPTLLHKLPGCLTFVSIIQSIFGIALLFLFGLGIRNRFRMK